MEKKRKVKAFFTIDPDLDKYFEKHIEENGKKCIFYEIMIIFVKINN